MYVVNKSWLKLDKSFSCHSNAGCLEQRALGVVVGKKDDRPVLLALWLFSCACSHSSAGQLAQFLSETDGNLSLKKKKYCNNYYLSRNRWSSMCCVTSLKPQRLRLLLINSKYLTCFPWWRTVFRKFQKSLFEGKPESTSFDQVLTKLSVTESVKVSCVLDILLSSCWMVCWRGLR